MKVHSEMAFLPVYGKLGSDELPCGQTVSPYQPIRGSELRKRLFDTIVHDTSMSIHHC